MRTCVLLFSLKVYRPAAFLSTPGPPSLPVFPNSASFRSIIVPFIPCAFRAPQNPAFFHRNGGEETGDIFCGRMLLRQKHPPAPSRKPALDGSWRDRTRLNASEAKKRKALAFEETPSREPALDDSWRDRTRLNASGAKKRKALAFEETPSRKPALDDSWRDRTRLNARSAKRSGNKKENSNVLAFGEDIAVFFLTICFLLLHWHSIRCFSFCSIQRWFSGGCGRVLLTQKHPPRKNYPRSMVFGRVREGTFDSNVSSRNYFPRSSPRSSPSVRMGWMASGAERASPS